MIGGILIGSGDAFAQKMIVFCSIGNRQGGDFGGISEFPDIGKIFERKKRETWRKSKKHGPEARVCVAEMGRCAGGRKFTPTGEDSVVYSELGVIVGNGGRFGQKLATCWEICGGRGAGLGECCVRCVLGQGITRWRPRRSSPVWVGRLRRGWWEWLAPTATHAHHGSSDHCLASAAPARPLRLHLQKRPLLRREHNPAE